MAYLVRRTEGCTGTVFKIIIRVLSVYYYLNITVSKLMYDIEFNCWFEFRTDAISMIVMLKVEIKISLCY